MREKLTFNNGDVILLTKSKHGCECHNRYQRLAAKRQANIILCDSMRIAEHNNDAHTSEYLPLVYQNIDEYLGEKNVCRECTRIYLQLLGAFHGEQIVERLLSSLYPLELKTKNIK